MNRDIYRVREDFAILNDEVAYLDNAATTQKPAPVMAAVRRYYETQNANPFRGVYSLSEQATAEYERARACAAAFIGAKDNEIIFTRNASESLNLVAYSYGMNNLKPGDEIAVSIMEHHSNFLPWRMVAQKTGAVLKCLKCEPDGTFSDTAIAEAITDKTKLLAITCVSNVFGRVNPVRKLADMVHKNGGIVVCDGAQSVPHMPTSVSELGADLLAFSGHKMLAPMGIGVLWGRYELLNSMEPFMQGGEMIETVHWDRVRYAEVPHKFEAGTVNVGGAVGLMAAIEYINSLGFDFIMAQERALTEHTLKGMKSINGVNVIGAEDAQHHEGIIAFTVDGVHPHDVSSIMNEAGVCIRAGHHCAQPLMDHLGVRSSSRVSFAFYNTVSEADRFLNRLDTIRSLMGYGR